MYIPRFFANDDQALAHAIVRDHAFGVLTTVPGDDGAAFDISHLPMLWLADGGGHGRIVGHVARANPHGKRFDGETASVAVFSGPHAYISPNWYANPVLVPTWNYAAVHLHGKPVALEDEDAADILNMLVAAFESDATGNWSTAALPDGVLSRQIKGIVAFSMPVARVETKLKMSQNRGADDVAGVVEALGASANPDDRATAAMMRTLNPG